MAAEPRKKKENAVVTDPRFARVHSDPRFRRDPRRQPRKKRAPAEGRPDDDDSDDGGRDTRFEIPPDDQLFASTRKVDKYGRPLAKAGDVDSAAEDDESGPAEDLEDEEPDFEGGLAPGEDEDAEEEEQVEYGKESARLAMLNADWDSLRAQDILAALQSFCPDNGAVLRVTVYPSNFGLERMRREAFEGPPVAADVDEDPNREDGSGDGSEDAGGSNDGNQQSDDDSAEDDSADDVGVPRQYSKVEAAEEKMRGNEAIRRYEKSRLKYYYAVIECDSMKTSSSLYDQCDGVEYGASGVAFDLRFVPDGVEFENPPRDIAEEVGVGYEPPNFVTKALQNTNVELTWDSAPSDRAVLRKKHLTKDEIADQDIKAYLAPASESSSEDEATVASKRSLLLGGENDPGEEEGSNGGVDEDFFEEEKDEAPQGEVEVSFEPGLGDLGDNVLAAKEERETQEQETPWEARLRRMRERKKEKRRLRKLEIMKRVSRDGKDEADDQFFEEANDVDDEQRKKEQERLELLTMDAAKNPVAEEESDDGDRPQTKGRMGKHARAKLRRKEKQEREKGRFKADLGDKRFEALLTSHDFALDPTHPKFVKNRGTGAMLKARTERQRSAAARADSTLGTERSREPVPSGQAAAENRRSELKALAARVRSKVGRNDGRVTKKRRVAQ